jgi:hypothetical protein
MEIQDGVYAASPVTAALGYTKGGKECVGVEFLLTESGKHMTWYGYFTEATTERTIESLRICGWNGNDLGDLTEIGSGEPIEVSLVIETEEWEGKTRQKVQWVNRAGGLAMGSPLNADQARAFGARMKGAVLAFDQKTGSPAKKSAPRPAARAQTNAKDASADEIPF